MKQEKVWREFASLSPELQQQVIDFIAFLRARQSPTLTKSTRPPKLAKEPFVGMWRNRRDLKDSTEWVRESRRREWASRNE